MASTTPQEGFEVQTVLAAMLTMRSGENEKKKVAVDYLGRFQKSVSPTLSRYRASRKVINGRIEGCLDDDDIDSQEFDRGRSAALRRDDPKGQGTYRILQTPTNRAGKS
jgi:hypothetical protein